MIEKFTKYREGKTGRHVPTWASQGFPPPTEGSVFVLSQDQAAWEAWSDAHKRLIVHYTSMPESNGKANWTAILCRDDPNRSDLTNMAEGFTIARSEYPDRVRYEADCVRHLIGELPDAPNITAYDDSLHSGYKPPLSMEACLDFFASVIKSGEPWTAECERMYQEAKQC